MHKKMTLEEIKKDTWLSKNMIKGFEDIFLSPYTRGEEAYFGKENPLANTLLKYIKEMRTLYEMTYPGGAKKALSNKKECYQTFQKLMQRFEKDLASVLNAEQVTIGLQGIENAFALPMCWDRNLVKREAKKKSFNEGLKISLEDIVENKDGFKFRKKEGKYLIICIGIPLFDRFTDGEIVAITLHELGHCLQHMLVSINGNVVNASRKGLINALFYALQPVSTILHSILRLDIFGIMLSVIALIISGILWIQERALKGLIDKHGEEQIGKEIILDIMDCDDFDRFKWAEEVKQMRKDTLKSIIKGNKGTNLLVKFCVMLYNFFEHLATLIYYTIAPVLQLTNVLGYITILGYNKYLRKERRYEQFADMFPTIYGYGPEQASALSKLHDSDGVDFGAGLNLVHWVPGLNLWIALGRAIDLHSLSLMNGYPPPKGRIESLYVTLEFELKNNPQLSKEQRECIKEQMADISDTYDNYVFSTKMQNFVFMLFNFFTRARVDKGRSDIENNVLRPLFEAKKYCKQKMKENNSDLLKPEKKMAIIDKLAFALSTKFCPSDWISNLRTIPDFVKNSLGLEHYNAEVMMAPRDMKSGAEELQNIFNTMNGLINSESNNGKKNSQEFMIFHTEAEAGAFFAYMMNKDFINAKTYDEIKKSLSSEYKKMNAIFLKTWESQLKIIYDSIFDKDLCKKNNFSFQKFANYNKSKIKFRDISGVMTRLDYVASSSYDFKKDEYFEKYEDNPKKPKNFKKMTIFYEGKTALSLFCNEDCLRWKKDENGNPIGNDVSDYEREENFGFDEALKKLNAFDDGVKYDNDTISHIEDYAIFSFIVAIINNICEAINKSLTPTLKKYGQVGFNVHNYGDGPPDIMLGYCIKFKVRK